MPNQSIETSNQSLGLVERLAQKYGVDRKKFYEALAKVAFPQKDRSSGQVYAPSTEEMMALLLVCEQYDLNPFLRQIYAFKGKSGVIVPVVGVDGWSSIINRQKDYDGMEIRFSPETTKICGLELPLYCEAIIYRKSLGHPVIVHEFTNEVFVQTSDVWKKYPRRMMRHKAIIQGARVAFGIGGIYDEDEAKNIAEGFIEGSSRTVSEPSVQAVPTPKLVFKSTTELDSYLTQLTTLAISRNSWETAESWLNENLEGRALEYGRNFVNKAKKSHASPVTTSSNEVSMEPVNHQGSVETLNIEMPVDGEEGVSPQQGQRSSENSDGDTMMEPPAVDDDSIVF